MKASAFLFTVLFLFCTFSHLTAQSQNPKNSPRRLIRVEARALAKPALQEFLELGLDVMHFDREQNAFEVIAAPRDLEQLTRMGVRFNTLIENLEAYDQALRAQGYLDHFHDYTETLTELQLAEALYPALVKLVDIGDSWEKTQGLADRDIWAVKISDNVQAEENEAEVLIIGNHHAREIITPEILLDCMNYLLQNYGSDPYVTHLVNQRQIWLIPTLNPDGLDYVHHVFLFWRKNRRNNQNGTIGVDLNRNYAFKWGYDNTGSSPNSGSDTYRGTAAFSEPETAALRDFVNTRRFRASFSYHSFGNLLIYPWGYIPQRTPDHGSFAALADSIVVYNGYNPGLGVETVGYSVNGEADDWLYGEQTTKNKIFALTPEVGPAFNPDTTLIETLILENRGPNLFLIYAAGEEPIVMHEPLSDTENSSGPYRVMAQILPPIILTQPVPLANDKIFVHYNTTGTLPFQTVAMTPTGNAREFAGEIPGAGEDQQVYYFISAEDDSGRLGHAPRAASAGEYFSFHVGADNVAPIIVHQPLGNQSVRRSTLVFRAQVTDNVSIASAQLFYRQNAGPWLEVQMAATGADGYEAGVNPASVQVGDRFEYYLFASDNAASPNTTRAPATGYYSFAIIQSVLYDFEPDNGDFTTTPPSDWEWGAPTSGPQRAYSGVKLWATKLNGNYSDRSDSRLDLPPIDLTGAKNPTLTFWHWYLMEYSDNTYWDGGNVKISANGGPFEIIMPIGGYDGIATSSDPVHVLLDEPVFGGPATNGNFWQKEIFDLSAYANQTVVLRFHFGSDGFVTEPGWYVDDVEITFGGSQAPAIISTTRLRNTNNVVGPYLVTSRITDDGDAQLAVLNYSTDGGASYIELPMSRLVGSDDFSANIAGQPAETSVRYYVEAKDEDDNVTRDPAHAPQGFYQFIVTNRVADIDVQPAQLTFNLSPDTIVVDSLLVFNLGLLDLRFTIPDSASALKNFPLEGVQGGVAKYREEIKINAHINTPLKGGRVEVLQRLLLNKGAKLSNTAQKALKNALLKFGEAASGVAISWLQVGIDSALVEGEKHLVVPLLVNTAGLQTGTHLANLVIHSNDPDEPITSVPVELIIRGTAVDEHGSDRMPQTIALKQSRPNPFSNSTVIPYELPAGVSGEIELTVYNLIGQRIRLLVQREQRPGFYDVRWDGKDDAGRIVPAGIYFYRLEGKGFVQVRKMVRGQGAK